MTRHRIATVACLAATFIGGAQLAEGPPPAHAVVVPSTRRLIHDVVWMVFKRYPVSVRQRMMRVAQCESGLRPFATNGQYRGLFQLSRWVRNRVKFWTGWNNVGYNAIQNTYGARYVWLGQGWDAWPVCGPRSAR